MAGQIYRSDWTLVHEKDHLAASAFQSRPVTRKNGLVQGVVIAAHVVGSNDFIGRKHGTDFSIERVKGTRGEWLRFGPLNWAARPLLFCLHENEDRNMLWVRMRPLADLLKAG